MKMFSHGQKAQEKEKGKIMNIIRKDMKALEFFRVASKRIFLKNQAKVPGARNVA